MTGFDEDSAGLVMPVSILDYVRAVTGKDGDLTGEDHWNAGVAILGGCEICYATIASYNAYPARSGSWRCAHCIGDNGYATVAEFTASIS